MHMRTPPYALRFTFTPQLIAPVAVVIASSCALGACPASVSMRFVSVYSALEGFALRITAVFPLYVYKVKLRTSTCVLYTRFCSDTVSLIVRSQKVALSGRRFDAKEGGYIRDVTLER